jgi:hypothetical protein
MEVLVDINLRSPVDFEKTQTLPPSTPNIFESSLHYSIIEESINKNSAKRLLEHFMLDQDLSTKFLREAIFTG